MPLLLIPIFLILVGAVMIVGLGIVFGLIHLLFWPLVIGLLVWWLVRKTDPQPRRQPPHRTGRPRSERQARHRKDAMNAHEEPKSPHHDDDWSDF